MYNNSYQAQRVNLLEDFILPFFEPGAPPVDILKNRWPLLATPVGGLAALASEALESSADLASPMQRILLISAPMFQYFRSFDSVSETSGFQRPKRMNLNAKQLVLLYIERIFAHAMLHCALVSSTVVVALTLTRRGRALLACFVSRVCVSAECERDVTD
jgi:hypothetical protein